MATTVSESADCITFRVAPNGFEFMKIAAWVAVLVVRVYPAVRIVRSPVMLGIAAIFATTALARREIRVRFDTKTVEDRAYLFGLLPTRKAMNVLNGAHVSQPRATHNPILQFVATGRSVIVHLKQSDLEPLVRRGLIGETEVEQLKPVNQRELQRLSVVGVVAFLILTNLNTYVRASNVSFRSLTSPTTVSIPSGVRLPAAAPEQQSPFSSSRLVQGMGITDLEQLACLDQPGLRANTMSALQQCAPQETYRYFRYAHAHEIPSATDVELECITPPVVRGLIDYTGAPSMQSHLEFGSQLEGISFECGLDNLETEQLRRFWMDSRTEAQPA